MIRDLEGGEHRLSEYRGKVLLLDFWATWCGPCVASLPRVDEVYRQFAGREDVVFAAVNTMEGGAPEERAHRIEETWTKLKLVLPVFLDGGMTGERSGVAATLFRVSAIPRAFIIDRTGTILFKEGGVTDDEDVEDLKMKIEYALSRGSSGGV
jgi:thiol-disulfide isomerase/thioredoxin